MKAPCVFGLLLMSSFGTYSQKWRIELAANPLASFYFSSRYGNPNGSIGLYKEIRMTHFLNANWGIALFTGHERRNNIEYLVVTEPLYREIPFFIERHLVPVGGMVQYRNEKWLSNFLKSKQQKWQFNFQAGFYTITGKTVYDKNKPDGNYIIRFEGIPDDYGNLNFTTTAGIGYKISNKWQVNLEGGFGALSYSMLYVGYTW
jgi:hypothetical protein